MARVNLFMHCNHLPSPGLCKVFELGIDRPNELELLFAPPAFALFFLGDGCANVLVALKVEQALETRGRSKTFQRAFLMLHDAAPGERPWRVRQKSDLDESGCKSPQEQH
jgi:hypothetical protein